MDNFEMMMKHIQDLRNSLSGEPSAATFAAWRLQDTKYAMLMDYYARQDGDDDFTFDFSSEVRSK